jgi:rfaE bifunctional protein kinase chain/domain
MSVASETAIAHLPGARVLAVGDLMLDEYVWGEVRRISPEAPVPVVEVGRRTYVPGGAANVAAGIVALAGEVVLGGVVGDDAQAEHLLAGLAERGVDCGGVLSDPSRTTTTKTRVIAHSQQVVRTDHERRTPVAPELEAALLAWVDGALDGVDAVVLSDYAKGVVSPLVAARVIEGARARGKPVIVDPKGIDYAKYRGATVLTPNLHDAERAAHFTVNAHDDVLEVGRRLAEILPESLLLITRGAEGMSLISSSGVVEVDAATHDVYDVTGAGDTVVATLAVALARQIRVEDAVRLANAAAGIVVSKVGTATVTLDELTRTLRAADRRQA